MCGKITPLPPPPPRPLVDDFPTSSPLFSAVPGESEKKEVYKSGRKPKSRKKIRSESFVGFFPGTRAQVHSPTASSAPRGKIILTKQQTRSSGAVCAHYRLKSSRWAGLFWSQIANRECEEQRERGRRVEKCWRSEKKSRRHRSSGQQFSLQSSALVSANTFAKPTEGAGSSVTEAGKRRKTHPEVLVWAAVHLAPTCVTVFASSFPPLVAPVRSRANRLHV